jgi:hypothetical protein
MSWATRHARLLTKRPSKYNAKRTVVDGITFHSKREAARYQELRLLVLAGQIRELQLQPEYPIVVTSRGGRTEQVAVWRGDFRYRDYRDGHQGLLTIEDCKGVRTPVYRLKKKLVEAIYGITITEV